MTGRVRLGHANIQTPSHYLAELADDTAAVAEILDRRHHPCGRRILAPLLPRAFKRAAGEQAGPDERAGGFDTDRLGPSSGSTLAESPTSGPQTSWAGVIATFLPVCAGGLLTLNLQPLDEHGQPATLVSAMRAVSGSRPASRRAASRCLTAASRAATASRRGRLLWAVQGVCVAACGCWVQSGSGSSCQRSVGWSHGQLLPRTRPDAGGVYR
jgi:hypothetical protein